MNSPYTYLIIGMGIHLSFWLSYKLLRKKWFLIGAIIISAFFAFLAFEYQGLENLQMKGGYAPNYFFSLALSLIIMTIFLSLFKIIYKNEPIIAGYWQTSWKQGGKRKLHLGDSLFTVITLVLPILIPLFI